ncbi:MAG TPA: succinate dehydrogenase, hydrophobic membrane anchor protein [Acetobacteraceae bacterium]
MREKMAIEVMRSQLGRARGTGTAHSGVHHWYAERITSIALVPLTLWFIFAVLRLVGAPQEAVVDWAGRPVNATLLLALIAITFHHMQLGLQVVYEDYIKPKWLMNIVILGTKAAALLLGLLASVAVLKMALA